MDLAQLPDYQKRVFVPENADLTDAHHRGRFVRKIRNEADHILPKS